MESYDNFQAPNNRSKERLTRLEEQVINVYHRLDKTEILVEQTHGDINRLERVFVSKINLILIAMIVLGVLAGGRIVLDLIHHLLPAL